MAVYALLLLVFLAFADWGFQRHGNAATEDADLVYCLAPAHLDGLVNAAVSLGLAGAGSDPGAVRAGGQTLPLAEWRAADGADFRRACDAYATVSMPARPQDAQSTGVQAVLAILLPVIAGALLTMAADDFKQAADRRWAQADELRTDWMAFESAVRSYVRARRSTLTGGRPSVDDLGAKRRTLAATLRKIHAQHRKSPTIGTLHDNLAGELGPSIADGWDGKDTAEVSTRAKQITDCLDTFRSSLEKVAGALERRIWLSSKL
jgi:hypothetical protein